MRHTFFTTTVFMFLFVQMAQAAVIIDHTSTNIKSIPESAIMAAKQNLHIAYGHTSHGSQLISGMSGLIAFANNHGLGLTLPNNIFAFNNGGSGGALDLHDYAMGGDVGYYPAWVNNTRSYLGAPNPATGRGTGANADVNVIIWSWCGQASGLNQTQMVDNYLAPMTQLEIDYPGVKFVYMTGHLDGGGATGNLNLRNNQIRQYCQDNNKILYDFADIESYGPGGSVNYMALFCNDNCDYDSDGNGSRDKNWAIDWQNSHTVNVDWYDCGAAHSQSLNGNRKGYAAWWLWARLAGWSGNPTPEPSLTVTSPNGGETWRTGEARSITWSASEIPGNVRIELLQNGSLVGTITTVPASQGSYTWTVGTYQGGTISAGSGYKIRVRTADGTTVVHEER